jgi:hypothetical protein
MRSLLLVLGLCSACASTDPTWRVRAVDGHALSTMARLDADGPPIHLRCRHDGPNYEIVAREQDYIRGMHLGLELPFVHDAAALCARIENE